MVTFRNNNNGRRNNFRRNDRNFKSNGDRQKFSSNFSNNENFKRKAPGRNNHNAAKLIEKYNDLAREALSNGDKILSENYMQHADHFTRVLNEREIQRRERFSENVENSAELSEEISDNVVDITDQNKEEDKSEVLEKKEVKNLIAVPACPIFILFKLDCRASDMFLVSSLVDRFFIVIFGKMDCKINSLLEILLDPLIVIFL